MPYNLKAYKAGDDLRVTLPKSIYDSFALIAKTRFNDSAPLLVFRARDREGKPFFAGYDFGLVLKLRKWSLGDSYGVSSFGKTTHGFTLRRHTARELGITAGTRLQCDVIPHTESECHDKAVVYKVVY